MPDSAGLAGAHVRAAADRLAAELDPPGTGSPLRAIAAARELSAAAEAAMQAAVDQARAAGQSWREIGDVLGTTRQAAFQRFGRPVDPRSGIPMSKAVLPGAAEKAEEIFACIIESRWEDARHDFGTVMRERLSADGLAAGWAQVAGAIGAYERMGQPDAFVVDEHTVVEIPLSFEAGEATGRIAFDADGAVAGLFIRPTSPWRASPHR